MLLLCIRSLLKSIVRYKLLTLYTHHPHTVWLHEQGCEDPWIFFEAKRVRRAKHRKDPILGYMQRRRWGHYFVSKRPDRINQRHSDISQNSVVISTEMQVHCGQVSQLTLQESSVRHFVWRKAASWRLSHGMANTSGRTRLGVRFSRLSSTSFSPQKYLF
jgi:hypothetical protein